MTTSAAGPRPGHPVRLRVKNFSVAPGTPIAPLLLVEAMASEPTGRRQIGRVIGIAALSVDSTTQNHARHRCCCLIHSWTTISQLSAFRGMRRWHFRDG
jgi:hypothetical protein